MWSYSLKKPRNDIVAVKDFEIVFEGTKNLNIMRYNNEGDG